MEKKKHSQKTSQDGYEGRTANVFVQSEMLAFSLGVKSDEGIFNFFREIQEE